MTCFRCIMYIEQNRLESLNEEHGDEMFPLDVEWAHCGEGPDAWLNCHIRKRPPEEAEG